MIKGQAVQFHALATDPELLDELTYSWDFGDGNTATRQHSEHEFSHYG